MKKENKCRAKTSVIVLYIFFWIIIIVC